MNEQSRIGTFTETGTGSAHSHPPPDDGYKDESWLREAYIERELSANRIADMFSINPKTVYYWLDKFGIERRSYAEVNSKGDTGKLHSKDWLHEHFIQKDKTAAEIADQLGCHKDTVYTWVDKHDLDTAPMAANRTDGNFEQLRDRDWLYRQYHELGKTTHEIADELGLTGAAVSEWLDKHDIETRTAGESKRENMPSKVNDQEWLYEQYIVKEKSMSDIADEVEVGDSTISRRLDEFDIEKRSRSEASKANYPDEVKNGEWLFEQYVKQEKTIKQIANELGVTEPLVSQQIDEFDIQKRSPRVVSSKGDIEKALDEQWLYEQYVERERSMSDISREINVSSEAVRKSLEEFGFNLRGISVEKSDGDIEKLKDEDWLRREYKQKQQSMDTIAEKIGVSKSSVKNYIRAHGIQTRSGYTEPDHLDHPVRSEKELRIAELLNRAGIEYEYEATSIDVDGHEYTADFFTDNFVIEVKGKFIRNPQFNVDVELTKQKCRTATEKYDRVYVVIGEKLPCDLHIPWNHHEDIIEEITGVPLTKLENTSLDDFV